MPLRPGYLIIGGAGTVLIWSGFKGKSWSKVLASLVEGKNPSDIQSTQQIQGTTSGGGISTTTLSQFGGNVPPIQGNVSPRQVYKAFRANGIPIGAAIMLTAITGVESRYNTGAFNDDAATGDYSVGITQINYYDGLLAERTALIGMGPDQLLHSGLSGQARATAILYRQSGLQPWMPDITSGKVNQFLGIAKQAAGQ